VKKILEKIEIPVLLVILSLMFFSLNSAVRGLIEAKRIGSWIEVAQATSDPEEIVSSLEWTVMMMENQLGDDPQSHSTPWFFGLAFNATDIMEESLQSNLEEAKNLLNQSGVERQQRIHYLQERLGRINTWFFVEYWIWHQGGLLVIAGFALSAITSQLLVLAICISRL